MNFSPYYRNLTRLIILHIAEAKKFLLRLIQVNKINFFYETNLSIYISITHVYVHTFTRQFPPHNTAVNNVPNPVTFTPSPCK